MTGETMNKILKDITLHVPPEESKLKYDDEMLRFRAEAEKEWVAHLEKNPDAELYLPNDLPEADIPVDLDE